MLKVITKLTLALSFGAVVVCPVRADTVPAQWNNDFAASLEYAQAHSAPLVLIWGNQSCDNCKSLHKVLGDSNLKAWLAEHPVVTVSKHDPWDLRKYKNYAEWSKSWTADYRAAREWIGSTSGKENWDFPIVGIYWKLPDGTVKAKRFFVGRMSLMPNKTGKTLAEQFRRSLDADLASYRAGAEFLAGGSPCDRLEARADTRLVEVPLRRTLLTTNFMSRLIAVFPDGTSNVVDHVWEAGTDRALVPIAIPETAFASGESVSLRLTSDQDAIERLSTITFVESEEPTPKDPLWIGERDLGTLQAGEWTMDVELAKARAAARGRPALVLVGGSLWCPDCVKTDHYLVDTPEFKAWLKANDVSCAAIDIPNVAKADMKTSLLTYEPYSTSDRYVSATTPNQERIQSGAGYLSRHMVPQEGNGETNATAVFARNLTLINCDTEHGGLCRPENVDGSNPETGPFKTGIPCLIVLRTDGTVAGRLYQFNNVSPANTNAVPAYLSRMDELVRLADEPMEEGNADWRTTGAELASSGAVAESLSAMDLADVYRLTSVNNWMRGTVCVKSDETPPVAAYGTEKNVRLSVLKIRDGQVVERQVAEGNVFAGVTLDVVCDDPTAEWFVEVRGLDVSKTFLLERADASTTSYSLTAALASPPSSIAFAGTGLSVNEKSAGRLAIPLMRGNGAAGSVTARVELDQELTTAEAATFAWNDSDVTWADGDASTGYVYLEILNDAVWDGPRKVALRLTGVTGPCAPTLAESNLVYVVSVVEDDKRTVGRLAITRTSPALAKKGVVVIRENATLAIGVTREKGSSGAAAVELKTTAGLLSSNRLEWAHADRTATKVVDLSVPSLSSLGAKRSLTVSLAAPETAPIDKARKSLTVEVVAADAPGFETDEVAYQLRRYVAFEKRLAVCEWQGGQLVLTRRAGSLPSGISARLERNGSMIELVLSGTPTKVQSCTAVYQVSEKRPGVNPTKVVTTHGTTVRLSLSVLSVVAAGAGGPALNPSVATSRTFSDQRIVDATNRRLAGLLTFTVPVTGKVSAKYRGPRGSVSFSAKRWDSCDEETGLLTTALQSSKGYALTVRARADGTLEYDFADENEGLVVTGRQAFRTNWGSANKATAWKGRYSVDCPPISILSGVETNVPTGDAWMTMNISSSTALKKGTVAYAGRLPNGASFSGSATLVKSEFDSAFLPVLVRTSSDFFTAVAEIEKDAAATYLAQDEHRVMLAADGADAFWRHLAPVAALPDEAFEVALGLYGGYYRSDENLELCARTEDRFAGLPLWFLSGGMIDEVACAVSEKKVSVMSGAANPSKLKMSFTRSTGVVTGSFAGSSWAGILLPGWGGCGACSPGEVHRPLVVGSHWRTVKVPYVTTAGKKKSQSVKRGGFAGIGESEGLDE